jgi:hypothetical protein
MCRESWKGGAGLQACIHLLSCEAALKHSFNAALKGCSTQNQARRVAASVRNAAATREPALLVSYG